MMEGGGGSNWKGKIGFERGLDWRQLGTSGLQKKEMREGRGR